MREANPLVYSETEEGPLRAHFFVPFNFEPDRKSPLILFLNGGFWDSSMPTQFVPQCYHFANRGALAVSVETRVQSTHGTGPVEAAEDLAKFLEWLAANKDELAFDPERVVIAGASGGAFLALQQVMPKLPKGSEPRPINPVGLILFSSLLDTTVPSIARRFPAKDRAKRMSPLRMMRRHLPPMLLCHGKSDRVTPFDNARRFAKGMKWRGNKVTLVDYENAEHSFFNLNVSELHYELTLRAADAFLVELGVLEPDDTVFD